LLDDRLRRSGALVLLSALIVAAAAAAVACGKDAATSSATTQGGLGAGPFPTLTPTGQGGAEACDLPARVATPQWIPSDLPWPPGSYVTKDLGQNGDVRRAQLVVPAPQLDLANYINDNWPKASYVLGESDAEPGKEIEQQFSKGAAEGAIKALVVTCDPGYQDVFLSFRAG
jgi:hypothetical protein